MSLLVATASEVGAELRKLNKYMAAGTDGMHPSIVRPLVPI